MDHDIDDEVEVVHVHHAVAGEVAHHTFMLFFDDMHEILPAIAAAI